ncbi:MAG TPA: HAMP domain-containing sensor histidine kinase [Pirellulales bacterium]|nr:HAMP domain-containing sensor histidine kinase [Pirellulales bacterium]
MADEVHPADAVSLEALEREKLSALAEFAAGAGHEMNNPLAVIAGRAQLLLRDETDPERRRELAVIHSQALRVVEMISDLMLFARPPAPQLAECDLRTLVNHVADEIVPMASNRGICVIRPIDAEPLIAVVDRTQIAVALRAVCDNALFVLSTGGTITLDAEATADGGFAIRVADDGPGISAEMRRHVFDPFYSGRSAGRGLGTGLSKAWRIVTNHGGRVTLDSGSPSGTVLMIWLPAREGAALT